eukprot:tig00020563_g11349.t1
MQDGSVVRGVSRLQPPRRATARERRRRERAERRPAAALSTRRRAEDDGTWPIRARSLFSLYWTRGSAYAHADAGGARGSSRTRTHHASRLRRPTLAQGPVVCSPAVLMAANPTVPPCSMGRPAARLRPCPCLRRLQPPLVAAAPRGARLGRLRRGGRWSRGVPVRRPREGVGPGPVMLKKLLESPQVADADFKESAKKDDEDSEYDEDPEDEDFSDGI